MSVDIAEQGIDANIVFIACPVDLHAVNLLY